MEIAGRQVDESELTQALSASVTCCILAAAGPQRSRVLATLYKDERTASLPTFPILEKVRSLRSPRGLPYAGCSGQRGGLTRPAGCAEARPGLVHWDATSRARQLSLSLFARCCGPAKLRGFLHVSHACRNPSSVSVWYLLKTFST